MGYCRQKAMVQRSSVTYRSGLMNGNTRKSADYGGLQFQLLGSWNERHPQLVQFGIMAKRRASTGSLCVLGVFGM